MSFTKKQDCESAATEEVESKPVLGFVLLGGVYVGATVRDIRLANEFVRQGYRVNVWWVFDQPSPTELNPRIPQRVLFHPLRYRLGGCPSGLLDAIGRLIGRLSTYQWRSRLVQRHPIMLRRFLQGLLRRVCSGVEGDVRLLRRFAQEMDAAGITHMLPSLEMFCPFVAEARRWTKRPIQYLVTFQGYEVYMPYAEAIGLKDKLLSVIRETVEESDFPAVSVGSHYSKRIKREIGLGEHQLVTIHPCIDPPTLISKEQAEIMISRAFPAYQRDVPLVTFLGRQDPEKGIDLLLYAASICRNQGLQFQLLICGPTAHGTAYRDVCRQIASHLNLDIIWGNFVSDELRSAIFQLTQVAVYPSIHDEPFGLAPVEALSFGALAIVPKKSGAAELEEHFPGRISVFDYPCSSLIAESLSRHLSKVLTGGVVFPTTMIPNASRLLQIMLRTLQIYPDNDN